MTNTFFPPNLTGRENELCVAGCVAGCAGGCASECAVVHICICSCARPVDTGRAAFSTSSEEAESESELESSSGELERGEERVGGARYNQQGYAARTYYFVFFVLHLKSSSCS